MELQADGTFSQEALEEGDAHVLLEKDDAVRMGLLDQKTAKERNYCAYPFCYAAHGNKRQRSGAGIKGGSTQAPRAKCGLFCMHPACMRGYHATCWSIAHRLVERSSKFEKND